RPGRLTLARPGCGATWSVKHGATKSPPYLRAQNRPPRAHEEAGFDQQGQHERLGDGLAVEALDGQPFRAAALHLRDERSQRDAEPVLLRLAQRHERAAAALDEERRLASEQDDMRAGNARRATVRALRPRDRSAVRLRRIGGREHKRLRLVALAG